MNLTAKEIEKDFKANNQHYKIISDKQKAKRNLLNLHLKKMNRMLESVTEEEVFESDCSKQPL